MFNGMAKTVGDQLIVNLPAADQIGSVRVPEAMRSDPRDAGFFDVLVQMGRKAGTGERADISEHEVGRRETVQLGGGGIPIPQHLHQGVLQIDRPHGVPGFRAGDFIGMLRRF